MGKKGKKKKKSKEELEEEARIAAEEAAKAAEEARIAAEEEAKRFYESNKKYRLKRIQEIEEERIKQEEGEGLDVEKEDEQCCDTVCEACELEQAGLVWLRYIIKKLSV